MLTPQIVGVLQERQFNVVQDTQFGVGGGRRTLKRNKTFTGTQAPCRQQTPPTNGSNHGRRHKRGTKGRFTVPLVLSSAPCSPIVQAKYPDSLTIPLYIQTSQGIYEEAISPRHPRESNVPPAKDKFKLKDQNQSISPKSNTSSSGFGSSSTECSPKSTVDKVSHNSASLRPVKKANFHFWLVICVQYLMNYFKKLAKHASRKKLVEAAQIAQARASPIAQPKTSAVAQLRDEPQPKPEQALNAPPKITPEQGSGQALTKKEIARVPKRGHLIKRNHAAIPIKEQLIKNEVPALAQKSKPLSKPYYTELHLGHKNQHYTTMAALEADLLEYQPKRLMTVASETKYITTVFEVRQRGFEEIADSVRDELQRWSNEHDGNLIIVCCEMQWSTPDKYRNVPVEIRMKSELHQCLRSNNRRVCDMLTRRQAKKQPFNQYVVFPESITEEKAGRRPDMKGCFGGAYRRYYADLLPWAHPHTAMEHKCWWDFDKHQVPDTVQWPLIAAPQKTTVALLNLISIKLDHL